MMEASPPRKFAFILHADVVGSTRLVQIDEQLAHSRIQEAFHRLSKETESYGGTVKEIRGDALLAVFDRASDAIEAAIAFQAANAEFVIKANDEIKPVLRIGIGMGEVIISDNTITGAGVILAQRLEQMAEGGTVVIQGAVHDATPKRLPFEYKNLGTHELKGFDEPISAFMVALGSGQSIPPPENHKSSTTDERKAFTYKRAVAALLFIAIILITGIALLHKEQQATPNTIEAINKPDEKPSIAVLPFENLSNDPAQEYFSDGITEDIITDLSRLSNLDVIARNSSFTYKASTAKIQDIGRDLGARYILQGSIRKSGDRVRITAQLVDATNGHQQWAERYDRKLSDIFALQDEITGNIVKALSLQLSTQEQIAIQENSTTNFDAYDLFLRGLQLFQTQTRDDAELAAETYRKAIELDPTFARSYGALAVLYARNYRRGWTNTPQETLDRALELANKAVEINSSLPQVYWALGYVQMFTKEYEKAEEAVKQAITIAPSYADGYGLLALIENQQGHFKEAIKYIKKGMALNPYYTYDYPYNLGRAYYLAGRYEEAVTALDQALAKNANVETARLYKIASLVRLGKQDDAEWEVEQLLLIHPTSSISQIKLTSPQNEKILNAFVSDLAKAGLPE